MLFQMMFAIITPALITGAFAERKKFSAFILFTLLWATFIYDPLAHWVWGDGGWLKRLGALDFAGGTVVHVSLGMSALVCAIVLRPAPRVRAPADGTHDLPFTVMGAALLWFGWFGFNAGSALEANALAASAFLATNTAAAAAALGWDAHGVDGAGEAHRARRRLRRRGGPGGHHTGRRLRGPRGLDHRIIGGIAGFLCYNACNIKSRLGYDDSLDVVGVHGVGWTWGALATGLFATKLVNEASRDGDFYGNPGQLWTQIVAVAATMILAVVGTAIILKVVDAIVGLRVSDEDEMAGLDLSSIPGPHRLHHGGRCLRRNDGSGGGAFAEASAASARPRAARSDSYRLISAAPFTNVKLAGGARGAAAHTSFTSTPPSGEGAQHAGPKDVLELTKEKGAKFVDLRFIDLPGLWQHFSIPVSELSEGVLGDRIGFDGSSIRGFQTIDESDMLLIPDPSTAVMDPFTAVPTLVLICNVKDSVTGKAYARDPRYIAQKAEAYVKKSGVADTVYIGPELEFFFDGSIRFDQTYNAGYYFIDSEAGAWNTGREGTPESPNLGYKPRYKQGYFREQPMDKFQDIRSEHGAGPGERGRARGGPPPRGGHRGPNRDRHAVRHADEDGRQGALVQVLCEEHRARVLWGRAGPPHAQAPLPGQRVGHAHASELVEERQEPVLRAGRGYADILRPASTTWGDSQARAGPAGTGLRSLDQLLQAAGAGLRSAHQPRVQPPQPLAAIRIPVYSKSEGAKRIEFRTPDPTCNPYLSFAACVMAGLDGVANKIDPGKPIRGQGPLRAAACGTEEDQAASGGAGDRAGQS